MRHVGSTTFFIILLLIGMVCLALFPSNTYISLMNTFSNMNIIHTDLTRGSNCSPFTREEREMLENGLKDQLNPRLLELIRCEWIHSPSKGPLNLKEPHKMFFTGYGQGQIIDSLLEKKTGGFFVECGAFDGEHMSNTLFFERSRNWTGLLIEANPQQFKNLLKKRRNTYSLNACLNPKETTGKFLFDPKPISGGLVNDMLQEQKDFIKSKYGKINVQCFTFNSVMKALGQTHIDLLSLDVEGAEVPILMNLPFSEFSIDVILVEYLVPGSRRKQQERFHDIYNLLNKTGLYELVGPIRGLDMLFVKKGKVRKDRLKEWRSKLSNKI